MRMQRTAPAESLSLAPRAACLPPPGSRCRVQPRRFPPSPGNLLVATPLVSLLSLARRESRRNVVPADSREHSPASRFKRDADLSDLAHRPEWTPAAQSEATGSLRPVSDNSVVV